jgi:hypothetical protein
VVLHHVVHVAPVELLARELRELVALRLVLGLQLLRDLDALLVARLFSLSLPWL